MRDQTIQGQAAGIDQGLDGLEIGFTPLRGDPQAGLAHEGGGKAEGDRGAIETGEDDLATRRQPGDEAIQDMGVAAHVINGAVIMPRIVLGREHRVAHGTLGPLGVLLPDHGGLAPVRDGNPRQETTQHPMTDHQIGAPRAGGGQGMVGGRGQGHEDGLLLQTLVHRDHARSRHHQVRRGAPKEAADLAETAGPGDKDALAHRNAGEFAGRSHAADGFITGDQGVAHARELRHESRPEQALGTRADAAPLDVHHDILLSRGREIEPLELELLGLIKDDG